MSRSICLCLIPLLTMASVSLSSAQDDPAAWVELLASDKLRTRKEAEDKLWKAGSSAIPALEAASQAKNPEAAIRAQKILSYLQLGLTPDSPKDIIELAQSFEKLSVEGKINAFQTLKQQRRFRIALLLFQREKDSTIQSQIREGISGLAIVAAREAMLTGNDQEAMRFLTDFPEDPKNITALAWVARTNGKLDEEIAKARASKDPDQWRYLLALLRIKGDRTAVIELAEKNNLVDLAAAMELLDGNPENWLRWKSENSDNDTRDITRTYTNVVLERLRNGKDSANNINFLMKIALRDSDYTRRWAAVQALYSLGNESVAQKAMQSIDPSGLFGYMAERERIDDALKALKLDPAEPDFGAWIDRNMKTIIDDEDSGEMEALISLIGFLEKRGIHDPLVKHFQPRMLELAEKDNERFTEVLEACFSAYSNIRQAPESAMMVASAYAKEDDLLWGSMISMAFSDNTYFTQWWEWLGQMHPEDKRADRFRKLLVLFRVIPDKKSELSTLDQTIEAVLQKDDPGAAENHRKLLSILSAMTRLSKYALLSLNDESEMDTDDLMNLERWEDAAVKWEDALKIAPDSLQSILWAAVCWQKAGNAAKAQEAEKQFEALVLSDSSMMLAASAICQHVGLHDKASAWRTLALNCGTRDSTWLISLYANAEEQLLTGQWKRAIAGYEAYLLNSLTNEDSSTMMLYFRMRKKSDMARGFSLHQKQPQQAINLLRECHQSLLADASLADQFFPALRLIGAKAEHDAWFEESWQALMKNRDRFPKDDNVRNSAAWLAARSMKRLDDAEREVKEALRLRPNQAAYLDTVAEIWFARGNRSKAIEWSKKAISSEPGASSLREQYHRFVNAPFPK
jgi:hypothetical protein